MSNCTPKSRWKANIGKADKDSYLVLATSRYELITRKSTRWRNPPLFFGSNLDGDTHGDGDGTGLMAASANNLGSS